MAESSPDLTLKLLMIGESGVGKSSVLLRYCENVFDDLAPTIGVDFKVRGWSEASYTSSRQGCYIQMLAGRCRPRDDRWLQ